MSQTILVVEDDQSLSQALSLKLTKEHYTVLEANDGSIGLEKALKAHPAFIILDVIMPHMSGMEMLSKLRTDDWGSTVPVLVLTNAGNVAHSQTLASDHHAELLIKQETTLDEIVKRIESEISAQ